MQNDAARYLAGAIVSAIAEVIEAERRASGAPIDPDRLSPVTERLEAALSAALSAEPSEDCGPSLFDDEDAAASLHEELGRAVSGMAEVIGAHAAMMDTVALARLREAHQRLFVAAAQVITGRKVYVSESVEDTLRLLGRRFDEPPVAP